MEGAPPGSKTFEMTKGKKNVLVVSGCRSSEAEHWQLKPEALALSPVAPVFFLSLCRFKSLRSITAQIIFH